MIMNHQVLRTTLGLATAILSVATGAQAGVFFSDDFNSGASALWGNQSGSWTASGGVYRAHNGYPVNCNALPFNLTDYEINLDINSVADGGIWLRTDGTGQNGILLVTRGAGWFLGSPVRHARQTTY